MDKIRKILISSFIIFGLLGLVYEGIEKRNNPPKEYKGEGDGFNDYIYVTIKAKRNSKGEIRYSEIKVKQDDTPAIAGPALDELIGKAMQKQTANLDIVAGATYTSEGFIQALKNASEKVEK